MLLIIQKEKKFAQTSQCTKLFYIWGHSLTVAEKAMATHSSTLAWKILWTEEPGRLQWIPKMRLLMLTTGTAIWPWGYL